MSAPSANVFTVNVSLAESETNFLTINAAIAAASAGDRIIVSDGTFGPVTIDKSIILEAENPGGVTIQGAGVNQGAAIRIAMNVNDVTVTGFTIDASAGDLAAVYAVGGNANLSLQNNGINGGTAHGFLAGTNGILGLTNAVIDGNSFFGAGPNALFYINGSVSNPGSTATGNTITNNNFEGGAGVGLLAGVESSGDTITGNTFSGAASYAQIEVWGAGSTVSGNTFGAIGQPFVDASGNYDPATILSDNVYDGPFVYIDGKSGFFTTLQAAVTAAAAGDTIVVGAGTYDENLTIDKELTILGPNQGLAGADAARADEAIIAGQVTISGSGKVVIDGMKFLNDTPVPESSPGVPIAGGREGIRIVTITSAADHEITNSVFESSVFGGATATANNLGDIGIFTNVLSTGSLSITNNLFAGDPDATFGAFSTAAWGRGIFTNGGGAEIKITGNTFQNTRTGLNLEGYANGVSDVSNNSFVASGTGIAVGNPTSGSLTTITDNSFTDVGTEFNMGGLSAAISFDVGATGNVALDGATAGLMNIISGAGNDTIFGTAGRDSITGGNGDDVIHAGPNDIVNGGAGTDFVVLADGLTAAELASITLTNVEGVRFESTPSGTFHVLAGMSIQAAVNAAQDGDTIIIGAGTFTETVTITGKTGLTILGAKAGVSAGVGGQRTASSTEGETILVGGFTFGGGATTVNNFAVDGLRIQGDAFANLRVGGTLTIENTIIQSTISGSAINPIILTGSPTVEVVVRGNSFTGNRGVSIENGLVSSALIEGNVFNNTASGVLALAGALPGVVTVTGNSFTGAVGASIVGDGKTFTDNTFSNTTYGLRIFESTGHTVTGNTFDGTGLGVWLVDGAGPNFAGNTLASNTFSGTGDAFLNGTANNALFGINTIGGVDFLTGTLVLAGNGAIFAPITGTSDSDTLVGTTNDDIFIATSGNDSINGLGGNDTYDVSAAGAGGAFVDLASGTAFSTATGFDQLTSIENVRGSAGDDVLLGSAADNVFIASGGHDTINGRDGSDTFDASAAATPVQVDLSAGTVSGAFTATLSNIENVRTGAGDDVVTDSGDSNVIATGAGDDTITLTGGNDSVDGGAGMDTVVFAGERGDYTITWDGTTAIVTDGTTTVEVINAGVLSFAAGVDVRLVSTTGDYTTIAAAHADSDDGDEILVGAGSFAGATITKDVILRGIQSGNQGYDVLTLAGVARSGGPETIITSQFNVNDATTTTIDGFRFVDINALNVQALEANVTFSNNVVIGGANQFVGGPDGVGTVVITGNYINSTTSNGFQINSMGNGAVTVSGNLFNGTGSGGAAVNANGIAVFDFSNNIVMNTSSHGVQVAGAMGTVTIDGNTFNGTVQSGALDRGAISVAGPQDFAGALTITNNIVSDSPYGIAYRGVPAADSTAITSTITGNTFTSVTEAEIAYLGTIADNVLTGGSESALFRGFGGNDTFVVGGGNDSVDGGAGMDTVVFAGVRGDYTITWDGTTAIVTDGTTTVEVINAGRLDFMGSSVFLVSTTSDEYATIQSAIADANPGDEVLVAAGTYTENLTVSSGIKVLGANAGRSHDDAMRGTETVIKGRVDVTGDDAILDGFTFTKPDSAVDTGTGTNFTGWTGVNVFVTGSGATIANSIVEAFGAHGGFASSGFVTFAAGGGASFTGSLVTAGSGYNALGDARGVASVFVSNTASGGVIIDGNTLSVSTANADAVNIFGGTVSVLNNVITTGVAGGIVAFGGHGDLVITDNDIAGYLDNGIRLLNFTGGAEAVITITGNSVNGQNAFQLDANTNLLYVIDGNTATLDTLDQLSDFVAENGGAGRVLVQFVQSWVPQPFTFDGKSVSSVKFGDDTDNTMSGGDGDDLLIGGAGDDVLEGAGGSDTVVLSGGVDDYEWSGIARNFTITDLRPDAPDGSDTVLNVENVQFADGTFTTAALFATVKLYDVDGGFLGGFVTIQEAVNAARDGIGDYIEVGAGDYEETVTVNKSVSIFGANAGVAHDGTRADESVLNGVFVVAGDGIVIDGFTIDGGGVQGSGVRGSGSIVASDITIANNILTGQTGQPILYGFGQGGAGASNWTVSGNLVTGITGTNATGMVFFNIDGLTVSGNTIEHDDAALTERRGINLDGVQNSVISDNILEFGTVTGTSWGVQLGMSDQNLSNVEVSGNTVNNSALSIFALSQRGIDDLRIINNTVGSATNGIVINSGGVVPQEPGVTFKDVVITGNTVTATGSAVLVRDLHNAAANGPITYEGLDVSGNTIVSGSVRAGVDGLLNIAGTNTFEGSAGNNLVEVEGSGAIDFRGLDGDDTFRPGAGGGSFNGGNGIDTLDLAHTSAAASVDLGAGTATGDDIGTLSLTAVENVIGSSGNDQITGNDQANSLMGGAGDDTLFGSLGDDTMDGGSGVNTVSYASSAAAVIANLQLNVAFGADIGNDTLANITGVVGGSGADLLVAAGTGSALDGGAGNDVLTGGAGNDTLTGGAGSDMIVGGAGTDTAVFEGDLNTYTITRAGSTYTIVQDGDTDTVSGIETFVFNGVTFDVTVNPDAIVGTDPSITAISEAAPDEDSNPATISIDENSDAGVVVATVSAADVNIAIGDVLEFALLDSVGDPFTGPFEIVKTSATTAEIRVAGAVDFEASGSFALQVQVMDSQGRTALQSVEIQVNDINEAPGAISIAAGPLSVDENTAGAVVTTLDAIDPDAGDTLTWSVDDARFEIVDDGGLVLRLKADVALDHETEASVTLTVTATDGDGLTSEREITFAVNDINEAPGNGVPLPLWTPDPVEAGLRRAVLTSTPVVVDPEGDELTYELVTAPVAGALFSGLAVDVGRVLSQAEFNALTYQAPETAGGPFAAQFRVSDGVNSTLLDLALTVSAAIDGVYTGDNADNLLDGGAGNDSVLGLGGNDTLFGGSGNDTLNGGAGDDVLDGGAGNDTAVFSGTINTTVNLALTGPQNTGHGLDTLISIENVQTSNGNDLLTGNNAANLLFGAGGNDTVFGGLGDDTLQGGSGDDVLNGGAGDDVLDGGLGIDTAVFSGTINTTVNLTITGPQNTGHGLDTLISIENIQTSSGNDLLTGNNGANVFFAGAGNDTLFGGLGNDTLQGGSGDDVLNGGAGDDVLDGSGGIDTAVFSGTINTTVNLTISGPQNTGHGLDTLISIENVQTSNGNDHLTGNNAANLLFGGGGNDTLLGGGGNDTLQGGSGDDVLDGGAGDDVLTGGSGADVFIFQNNWGTDTVTDFNVALANEFIDLSAVSAIVDFDDLAANHLGENTSGDAVITVGANSITLIGVRASNLTADDFLF